jgi:signal transduction histidine kinase
MKSQQSVHSNAFLESERTFLEVSGSGLSRIQFLQFISNQLQKLSGCDAVEMRAVDGELQYRWFTDFKLFKDFAEVQYISNDKYGTIPVRCKSSALEEICHDLFLLRFDPILHYQFSLSNRYITDTSSRINLTALKREITELTAETEYGSILFLPFMVQDNPPGLIMLYSKKKHFINTDEIPAYENLMHTYSIALKFRRTMHALNERIKELTCLYDINGIYENNKSESYAKIVQHIPAAFQYADVTSACIRISKREYHSDGFSQTDNHLKSNIVVGNKVIGSLAVYYPELKNAVEPMHFLPEEQRLLDMIAQKISMIIDSINLENNRLEMEEQLRHADRLATIGQLASGIAHELNDPLANILGYAQLLLKTIKQPEQVSDLERIVRSSLNAREIVRKLLMFARQMPTMKSRIHLNKIITDSLDLLKSRLEQGKVQVKLKLASNLPAFTADPSQITQLITNLSVNAMQAMPQGGTITIITSLADQDIRLEMADTGIGISEEALSKIFMPFYTTKPVGIGTGLGLSVVHGIVISHHGKISVQSQLDQGSTFIVTLPVSAKQPTKKAEARVYHD